MKRRLIITVALSLAVILAACGGDSTDEGESAEQTFQLTDEEKVGDDDIVANINGTDITGDKYNLAYLQTKVQLHQFGQDTEDKESLQEFAMNALVEQEDRKSVV